MNTQNPTPKDKTALPAHSNGAATETKAPAVALPVDLATLTDQQLAAIADEAPREIQRRKAKAEAELFELVRARSFLLGDVTPARLAAFLGQKPAVRVRSDHDDGRHDVKPLYRNPANHAETWAGRGRAPEWMEFGTEINPKTNWPLPLRKFWISEQEKK